MTGVPYTEVTTMIDPERLQQMEDNFWAETNDPASEEWREELTAEEVTLVAEWDARVEAGITRMIVDTQNFAERHFAPYPLFPETR